MKSIYTLRTTVTVFIFGFEVSGQKSQHVTVSYLLVASYSTTVLLCAGFFLYHQGRKLFLDFIAMFAPCLRGRCFQYLANGCCCRSADYFSGLVAQLKQSRRRTTSDAAGGVELISDGGSTTTKGREQKSYVAMARQDYCREMQDLYTD
mmetsp:Transcript_26121/g.48696  ORF Transcript_26121/g.48696 Transcript_26121/m.48696 type:complete len:149 (+) Transcript_26121:1108-1554(+)